MGNNSTSHVATSLPNSVCTIFGPKLCFFMLQIVIAFISVTCSICCTDAVACRHTVCSSIICEF